MDDFGTERAPRLPLKPRQAEAKQAEAKLTGTQQTDVLRALNAPLPRPSRYSISAEQIERLKSHKSGIEGILLCIAIGVCLGSATGSITALTAFLASKALTVEGFVQNVCFFSSLLVAIILSVIYWPKRDAFLKLLAGLKSPSDQL